MNWLLLAILSALLLGLYDVAKKASLEANAVLPVLLACSLVGVALVLPVGFFSWLAPEAARAAGLLVEPLGVRAHGLVLAKAGIVTSSWVLTFFAIKHLPISLAAPVRSTAPLFVLLGAFFLFGERPSGAQWLGIGAILASYWAFSLLGRAEGIHFGRDRWIWLMMAGTVVGAASGLYDKHLLQRASLPPVTLQFWSTLYNAGLLALVVGLLWWPRRRATTRFQWRWSFVAVGALLLAADQLYFRSLAQPAALISVVSIVRRSNVIVSFTVGSLAFRERNRMGKAGALAGVLVGLLLLLR
jgi:drug/metabolite transporter (DMT)-like permease